VECATHRLDLSLLERAQELDLHREGDFSDLIQKEAAVVGLAEATRSGFDRAGERSLDVSKELGLEHRLGQGRTVRGDEVTFFAWAVAEARWPRSSRPGLPSRASLA
jgi:hypothetical protein